MGEMGESGDPIVRSVDHGKLLDYGLDAKVADQLEEIFQVSQAERFVQNICFWVYMVWDDFWSLFRH